MLKVRTRVWKCSRGDAGTRSLAQLLCLAAVLVSSVDLLGASGDNRYDGKWWLSVNERQRRGFVHGFLLCYSELVDRQLFEESYSAYSSRLTEYLKAHPEASSESADVLLQRMAAPPYARPVHKPAGQGNETPEQLNVKWGPYENGDGWRAGAPWNLGYIQGFLECYSKHTKSEHGTFSKPAEWYVKVISRWYGTKEGDPDALDMSRAQEKIPEVLFRFRDKDTGDRAQ